MKHCNRSSISMLGESSFKNNFLRFLKSTGGAIIIYNGTLNISGTVYFLHNRAFEGGALYLRYSEAFLMGQLIIFEGNSAEYGGAMKIISTDVTMNTNINFSSNVGQVSGGAWESYKLDISPSLKGSEQVVVSGIFVNNTASCGGAIAVSRETKVMFNNTKLTGNSKSGLCISESEVSFEGCTGIFFNTGELGGGIQSKNSVLFFWGHTRIENNSATVGGGIGADSSVLEFNSVTVGAHNSAHSKGGVIYALNSNITVRNTTTFLFNYAKKVESCI